MNRVCNTSNIEIDENNYMKDRTVCKSCYNKNRRRSDDEKKKKVVNSVNNTNKNKKKQKLLTLWITIIEHFWSVPVFRVKQILC